MTASSRDTLAWSAALVCTVALLMTSATAIGCFATLALAAQWCRRLDREDDAFQVVEPDDVKR